MLTRTPNGTAATPAAAAPSSPLRSCAPPHGAAVTAAVTYAIGTPAETWPAPTAIAGLLVGVAGAVAACWPHPREWRDDGWMAIVNATREHPIYADWDTRELTENRNTR